MFVTPGTIPVRRSGRIESKGKLIHNPGPGHSILVVVAKRAKSSIKINLSSGVDNGSAGHAAMLWSVSLTQ